LSPSWNWDHSTPSFHFCLAQEPTSSTRIIKNSPFKELKGSSI
jgi:hypothetical protein